MQKDRRRFAPSRFGGLTLVAMPGFKAVAKQLKLLIEGMADDGMHHPTSVDIAYPNCGKHQNREPFNSLSERHIVGHDCFVLTSGPGNPNRLVNTWATLNSVAGLEASRATLVAPYLFLTRSDKREKRDFALVGWLIRMTVAAAQGILNKILGVNLHSRQQEALGPKDGFVTEVSALPLLLKQALRDGGTERTVLMYTDAGARDRFKPAVEKVETELGIKLPRIWGDKERADSFTSECVGVYGDVKSVSGARVLLIDDEAASCGTLIKAASFVKEHLGAASCVGVVIHAVLCGKAPELLLEPECPLDHLYVTDTIPLKTRLGLNDLLRSSKITVVTWINMMAEIIYCLHWLESIDRFKDLK
ncbi:MAG: ribose-phosphate pyrophosphokinase [Candidatus Vogelbacteria bacterium]|nr:ribose-phosphate pyrophosphokinase [Candidatus Vogelbacteria bacterium]